MRHAEAVTALRGGITSFSLPDENPCDRRAIQQVIGRAANVIWGVGGYALQTIGNELRVTGGLDASLPKTTKFDNPEFARWISYCREYHAFLGTSQ